MQLQSKLETGRLLLRRWRPADADAFARINADPIVMEHFPRTLTPEQTKMFIAGTDNHFEREGFGLWAVELKGTGEFIGFVGLSIPSFQAHFTPCVEVGWRLAHEHWGKGYAPEAAQECLRDGFERVGLDEIISLTARQNTNSMRVMEKIGMTRKEDEDFKHPFLEDGHHLQWHVLYRLQREDWERNRTQA